MIQSANGRRFWPPDRSIPRSISMRSVFTNLTLTNVRDYLVQQAHAVLLFGSIESVVIERSSNPDVEALTGMFEELHAALDKTLPIKYPLIVLSIPNTIYSSRNYCEYFHLAAQQAGFSFYTPCQSLEKMALRYHYIEDCYADSLKDAETDTTCDTDTSIALIISYTPGAVIVSYFTRWLDDVWGLWGENGNAEDFELGSQSPLRLEKPTVYWNELKNAIEGVVEIETVDRVLLLGSGATDVEFRSAVTELLSARGARKSLPDLETGGKKHTGDGLWFGSRGAAVLARRGMWHGFNACMPNTWCNVSKYHDEL